VVRNGFCLEQAGHIVTNFHVVYGANSAPSRWPIGRYKATLIGADPITIWRSCRFVPQKRHSPHRRDVAGSCALDRKYWRSETVRPGSYADDRRGECLGADDQVSIEPTIEGVIQTDAAINPGNSGGHCSIAPAIDRREYEIVSPSGPSPESDLPCRSTVNASSQS
jgi:hypothetical protein